MALTLDYLATEWRQQVAHGGRRITDPLGLNLRLTDRATTASPFDFSSAMGNLHYKNHTKKKDYRKKTLAMKCQGLPLATVMGICQ